jgi:tellurite resistance protein
MARRRSTSGIGIGGAIGIGVLLVIAFVAQHWVYFAVAAGVGLVLWLFVKWASLNPSVTADRSPGVGAAPAREARVRTDNQPPQGVRTRDGDAFWVAADKTARFNGRPIGSFIYVGEGLASADGQRIEPALIDARLPVDTIVTDCSERRTPYWPTYYSITSQARAALLNWLATGRSDPKADVGYVFLYFYGLERRALHDASNSAAARRELPAIAEEVQRLLSLYGGNRSFYGYATQLLDMLSARSESQRLYLSAPPPVERGSLTFRHRLGLAQCAADGHPLPAPWALSWLYGDWDTRLRTPATRCRDQFERLFATRYRAAFGDGLVLPKNRTRLTFDYRPASPGFRWGAGELKRAFELPDVSVLTAPLTQLRRIAEACTDELGAYSRLVGRDANKAATFDGMLELPVSLWPESVRKPVEQVKSLLTKAGRPATLPFSTLRSWFPEWRSINKAKMQSLARALAQAGVGIEPDARFGGAAPDDADKVVLFADEGEQMHHASARYSAAAVMLRLAVSVAAADGTATEDEQGLLAQQLEKWLHLNEAERRRLNAYLKLLIAQPPGAAGLKKAIEPLDMNTRESMGEFLALLAQVDGTVSAAEVKVLEKLFKLLGLDSGAVYSKVHAAATEPVAVRPAQSEVVHPIPKRPAAKPAAAVQLDPNKVAALQADSERVAALLGAIFAGEPEPVAEAVEESPAEAAATLLGLDAAVSAFARTLLERSEWARADLEELAADRGIMLDGALERINEAALDAHDAPLLEGSDPVAVNPDVVKELVHEHQAA